MAQDERGNMLSAPQLKRVLLNDINHIAIMDDERVYQELRQWLKMKKVKQTAKTLTLS
ncbi:MAG: hypothetical protein NVS3B3_22510 [Aquirhabdus sp.]